MARYVEVRPREDILKEAGVQPDHDAVLSLEVLLDIRVLIIQQNEILNEIEEEESEDEAP